MIATGFEFATAGRILAGAGRAAELPDVLALESARRWLIERGVPAGEVVEPILRRLLAICSDAASPSRTHFPGAVLVRRRRGMIERAALTRL